LRSPKFETINLKSLPGHVTPQKNSPGVEAINDEKPMLQNENDLIKLTMPPKVNLQAPASQNYTNSPPVVEPSRPKQHNFVNKGFTKVCADRQYNYIRKKSEVEAEMEPDLDKTNEEIELIDLGINMETISHLQFEQAQYSR
jgi:hypothetical protein